MKSQGIGTLYSMALTLSLSAVPLLLLSHTVKHSLLVKSAAYDMVSSTVLHQQLSEMRRSYEAMGLKLMPRIHPRGVITTTNSQLVLFSRTPALLPDRISDAITWGESDFPHTLRVSDTRGSLTRLSVEGCFIFHARANLPQEYQNFLLATRDGLYEAREVQNHASAKQRCHTLTLALQDTLIASPKEEFLPQGLLFVVPLKRINTIYRDTQGSLRYVGSSGSETIENQPMRDRVPYLRFFLSKDMLRVQFGEKRFSLKFLRSANNYLTLLGFL